MKRLKSLVLCTLAALTSSAAIADTQTATIPVVGVKTTAVNLVYGVSASIGGGPSSLLMLDTGSTGITVFASQLGNTNVRYTNIQSSVSYGPPGDNYTLHGVIAYAPVSFGNGISTPPIPVLVIKSVDCYGRGNCLGSLPGEPPLFHVYYGLLGASMGPNDVNHIITNPFLSLPGNLGKGYILQNFAPMQGGQVVVGLTPQNTQGFNRVKVRKIGAMPNGTGLYNDKSLRVTITMAGQTKTLPTFFDSAANSNVTIYTTTWPGVYTNKFGLVMNNVPFEAKLGNAFDLQFTTGADHGINTVRIAKDTQNQHFNLGTIIYNYYDVLYDPINGQMGFKQH